MNSFDSSTAQKMVLEGYLISPQDAQVFQKRCSENPDDWEARLKLLGFYHAHQLCCQQNRSCRIENIIWTIDNVPKISRAMRTYLLVAPGDQTYVPQVRAAFQRRIDAAPNDPTSHENMGDFLLATMPGEACSFYEKALSLDGDKKYNEMFLRTAKHLEKHGADITSEDYGQERMTCFFEVLQAGDQLLLETRNRMQPNQVDWSRFLDIAKQLLWSPMLLVSAQHGNAPVDAPATTLCKYALRQNYKMFDAKSELGRALRKQPLKALWKDLVMP
jgi:hypothetical protein